MDPFITPQRVGNLVELASWRTFTKTDVIKFISSVDFAEISVPSRYASSLEEESMESFLELFFAALSREIFKSAPPKASPKELLRRFHISDPEIPPIKVSHEFPTIPTGEPPMTLSSSSSTRLYLDNLDPTVTEVDLYAFFDRVGGVASIRVCRDRKTNSSLGNAYVNFYESGNGIMFFHNSTNM